MTKSRSAAGFFVCFVVAFGTAAVGAIASVRAAEFYQALSRPAWAPPAGVFGPVWTFLYACMALASWLVWRGDTRRRTAALVVYVAQLALNAAWSWLFFIWHQGTWAFVEVLVLWAAILVTTLLFARVRRAAGLLLVPYLAWVSFASCLTFAVWKLNPDLLS